MPARPASEFPQDLRSSASILFCEERYRLMDDFLDAVRELNILNTQQTHAVIAGDPDFARFDIPIHMVLERKDSAKYALIAHIEHHRCEEELWLSREQNGNELLTTG